MLVLFYHSLFVQLTLLAIDTAGAVHNSFEMLKMVHFSDATAAFIRYMVTGYKCK